jgi:hypothetical protein
MSLFSAQKASSYKDLPVSIEFHRSRISLMNLSARRGRCILPAKIGGTGPLPAVRKEGK